MLTFQQLIAKLNTFWETRGCIIHLGHDVETGAGTFNPATFLRCLGPEPYFAAYVEPSRRPKDGRYGENPNRIQLFHQYQVIMKPSPMNIQESYLQSLAAVGLNLKEHDIRFVHDDWESPTIGAFGLGWEVWVDGMEVTQFTYFQGLANLSLSPVTAEISYGLERLAMYLQNVDSIFDVHWNEQLTMRDLIHRNEVEWSAYNFTAASTEMWLRHFDDYEKEAKSLIGRSMPLPAYDFVIKASHAFNILEARGVISVTERTGYIARIRELSRFVASEYLTSREKLGYPLLSKALVEEISQKLPALPATFSSEKKGTFLLEIGSEELPATFVPIGMGGLQRHFEKLLKEEELSYSSMEVFGTPRRLSVLVHGLAEAVPQKTILRKGPSLQSAFDDAGKATKQGEGFLKSVDCQDATLKTIGKGKFSHLILKDGYLYAEVKTGGESIYSLMREALPKLILNLEFPKKMRWGSLDVLYPRPIHWIVALYDQQVISFRLGNVLASNVTYGHAQQNPESFTLSSASAYVERLKKAHVLVDVEERIAVIQNELKAIESQLNAHALEKAHVLDEIVHLTEWPELAHATFDSRFLKAPQEVLISEMVEHQRYFPLTDQKGTLKNSFVITADQPINPLIIAGNQKVLSARLSDGTFLYEQDLKTSLEDFNQKLKKMTFQKDLGSVLEKVMRIATCADALNAELGVANPTQLARAALLCKADLASELVGEFPKLQGTIGKYYARAGGEEEEVAVAIEEHWLPLSEKGSLPKTPVGIILSLADKLDNLISYFRVGLKPTASSDPYALRRQTLALLKILIENDFPLNLFAFLQRLDQRSPIEEIMTYITNRAKGLFEELGYSKDSIEASLRGMLQNPCDQLSKVKALDSFRKSEVFPKLFEVYKRAKGQLTTESLLPFDPSLLQEPAEKQLFLALEHLVSSWGSMLKAHRYTEAFKQLASLQPPLAHLFDTVKILADDPKLRHNRIALLQKVFTLFEELLDFSKIQGL